MIHMATWMDFKGYTLSGKNQTPNVRFHLHNILHDIIEMERKL